MATKTFGRRSVPTPPAGFAEPARKRSVAAPFAAAAVVAAGAAYAFSGPLSRPFSRTAAPAAPVAAMPSAPVAACDPARTPGCAQTQQSSRAGFVYIGSGGGTKTAAPAASGASASAAAPASSGTTARGGFGATGASHSASS